MGGFLEKAAAALGLGKDVAQVVDSTGGAVTGIIAAARGTLTPEAQAEIEKLKLGLGGQIAAVMQGQAKTLQDFVLQYEGTAGQVPKAILILRSLIRPAFTIFFYVVLIVAVGADFLRILQGGPLEWKLLGSLPDPFWWIFGIVITFWFGDRAVSSVLETFQGKPKK
jgi:hypothetical protein